MSAKLYALIQSLDKNEKGYFIKISRALSGKTNTAYVQIFKILDTMPTYSDEAFKKESPSSLNTPQIHRLKNYLYNLLLDILVFYNREKSTTSQVQFKLLRSELLQKKKLPLPSEQEINTALLALENEYEPDLKLFVWGVYRKWTAYTTNWEDGNKTDQIYKTSLLEFEKHHQTLTINYHFFKLDQWVRKYQFVQNQNQFNSIQKLLKPIANTKYQQLDIQGKALFNQAHFIYAIATYQKQLAGSYLMASFALMQDNPRYKNRPELRAAVLYNLVSLLSETGQIAQANDYLQQFKQLVEHHTDVLRQNTGRDVQLDVHIAELTFCIFSNQSYLKIEQFTHDFTHKNMATNSFFSSVAFFQLAHYHLLHNNPSMALRFIHKFIHHPELPQINPDMAQDLLALQLWALYQKGDIEFLENRLGYWKRKTLDFNQIAVKLSCAALKQFSKATTHEQVKNLLTHTLSAFETELLQPYSPLKGSYFQWPVYFQLLIANQHKR